MDIKTFEIQGLQLITLKSFADNRGFFVERYNQKSFQKAGLDMDFVQDNFSTSQPGVLRGLHYQFSPAQTKFITCLRGTVLDVAVDLRKDSPTLGKHQLVELDGSNPQWFLVPAGFAHGFLVTSKEPADVLYKVNTFYSAAGEGAILWNDPELGISWPISHPILSSKDAAASSWSNFKKNNPF